MAERVRPRGSKLMENYRCAPVYIESKENLEIEFVRSEPYRIKFCFNAPIEEQISTKKLYMKAKKIYFSLMHDMLQRDDGSLTLQLKDDQNYVQNYLRKSKAEFVRKQMLAEQQQLEIEKRQIVRHRIVRNQNEQSQSEQQHLHRQQINIQYISEELLQNQHQNLGQNQVENPPQQNQEAEGSDSQQGMLNEGIDSNQLEQLEQYLNQSSDNSRENLNLLEIQLAVNDQPEPDEASPNENEVVVRRSTIQSQSELQQVQQDQAIEINEQNRPLSRSKE